MLYQRLSPKRSFSVWYIAALAAVFLVVSAGQGDSGRAPAAAAPAGLSDAGWRAIQEQMRGAGGPYAETKVAAGDAQVEDRFGVAVAISGDTLVVGAYWEDGGPGNPLAQAGAAYVFERNQGGPGAWGQVAKLAAGDAQADDRFGVAVAISGDTVVVGAYLEDGGPGNPLPNAGAAYVFERDQGGPGAWGQVAKLTAGDAQAGDNFGWSVAVSGDTAVAGAYQEDGGPGNPLPAAGAAYVFERNQGGPDAWGQVAKLVAGDAQTADYFGLSVAVSGDTAVAGAYQEDGGPGNPLPEAGAAYVFERDQGGPDAWGQVAKVAAGDAQGGDQFGGSAAISGDTLVVGANAEDGGPGNPLDGAGAAYVFERNQGGPDAWGQVAKLTAGDAQAGDQFGGSAASSDDTLVVGADREEGGPGDPLPNAGAAYVFERNASGPDAWSQVIKLAAGDAQAEDYFGRSVAISGDTVVAGAPEEDRGPGDPVENAGAAYVYWRYYPLYLPVVRR
ncbi:MAG: FG-GAP repeat protein [Chloroflexi bacterium]|nr:FG-GAP repeat protein [Chloroflexota bacterium]MCI0644775.1 FG-GAP repeat protein [Chloroflexota bacterium]